MKKGNGKAVLLSVTSLAILGGLYYFFIYKKKDNGQRADFIVDGFVYSVGSKAQAYPKKAGEFGGYNPKTYKEDKNYWIASNSKQQDILLKKSDVKIV